MLRGLHQAAADQFATIVRKPPQELRAVDTARIYAQVGQTAAAVRHLERAFSIDASCAGFVNENAAFARYRSEPLVAALLQKYGGG